MTGDTRDVIARAIAGDSIDYSEYQYARVFRQVNTILAALAAKGLVIVPREATKAMIKAWSERTNSEGDCPCERKIAREWRPEDYSKEWARVNASADWRAMIAAGGDDA